MPSVAFDASSLVGALLKPGSIPERALLLARSRGGLCLSEAVEAEIRDVLGRPKFRRHITSGRLELIVDLIVSSAVLVVPAEKVTDCRDAKDNISLELALAAGAATLVSSDNDLLDMNPWRGIAIVTPAQYLSQVEGTAP